MTFIPATGEGQLATAGGQVIQYAASSTGAMPSYVPPNSSQPVPTSQISNGSALNLPNASSTNNGAGLVSSTMVGNTPPPAPTGSSTPATDSATDYSSLIPSADLAAFQAANPGMTFNEQDYQQYQAAGNGQSDYTQDPNYIKANQQYEKGINDYSTAVANEPSHATLMTNAENAQGIPDLQNKLASINTQIAEKTAAFQNASQNAEVHGIQNGTPSVFYQGEQAAIQRQQAVVIGGLSAVKAALQGNYDLAEARAKQTADLQFQDAEKKITNAENFIKLNQNNLNNAEKIAVAKIKANVTTQKADLIAQKANVTLALSNGVQSQFFTKPDGTVVRTSDGVAFKTPDEAIAAGVLPDFSNAPRIQNVGKSETKTINGRLVHVTYDKSGTNVISQTDLGDSGQPGYTVTKNTIIPGVKGSTNRSTPQSSTSVKTATNTLDTKLQTRIGANGKVSPQDWITAREAWIQDKHPVSSFYSAFKKYVDPTHPQDYPGSGINPPKSSKRNL